ncbi:MAG: caspase family protein [Rhizobiales bacterium]|nr:caspase family protein [Hyphomicrobiales bacterium]
MSGGCRVALVIENSNHEHIPVLPNAANDARAPAQQLTDEGFQSVTLKLDLKRDAVALSEFTRLTDNADRAIVYYSGLGIEYKGINYLISVNARLRVDRDSDLETVDLGKVLSTAESARRLRLVVLDACRSNPFLGQMKRTIGTRSVSRRLVLPLVKSILVALRQSAW